MIFTLDLSPKLFARDIQALADVIAAGALNRTLIAAVGVTDRSVNTTRTFLFTCGIEPSITIGVGPDLGTGAL